MSSDFIRIVLLIMSIVLGLVGVHSLSLMNNTAKGSEDDFEEMFFLLGKSDLKDQKRSLYKLSLLLWIIYIPYFSLAFYLFDRQTVPFILMISLVAVVLGDYIYQLIRIKKAVDIKEVAVIGWLGKFFTFLNVIIFAVLIAYLI